MRVGQLHLRAIALVFVERVAANVDERFEGGDMPGHHGQEPLESLDRDIGVTAGLGKADHGFHHGEPDLW